MKAVTVLVLLGALGVGMARKAGGPVTDEGPEAVVYAMLDAARAGDVKRYLSAHEGTMAATLRRTVTESSERKFARYLMESNAALKGVAVQEPRISGDRATVRVEYVYQDRNEVQTIYLNKSSGGWKVGGMEMDQRVPTMIPYGTPVK